MNNPILQILGSVVIGVRATMTFDLWALFLKYAFRVTPSNFCLLGRWILYMPEGVFNHAALVSTPQKNRECTLGWIAHYMTGIVFAFGFIAFAGDAWLQQPTLIPAFLFGAVTVAAPFFIMQPAFGLGVAASKTSNSTQARIRSVMNHTVFGAALYILEYCFARSYRELLTLSLDLFYSEPIAEIRKKSTKPQETGVWCVMVPAYAKDSWGDHAINVITWHCLGTKLNWQNREYQTVL